MKDKLISTALAEVGYLEKASDKDLYDKTANAGDANFTKYGAWYDSYYNTVGFISQPWCHMYLSWCAFTAGIDPDIIPYTASCPTGSNWFKTRGLWRERSGYTPESGDIIYFSWSYGSVDHAGLVTGLSGNTVLTAEGNTSGGSTLVDNGGSVAKKSYDLSYSRILGYGKPEYTEQEDEMTQEQFDKMWTISMAAYSESRTYKTISDVPDWGRPTVSKLMDKGIIQGDGADINITYDMLRVLVINDRAGLYPV